MDPWNSIIWEVAWGDRNELVGCFFAASRCVRACRVLLRRESMCTNLSGASLPRVDVCLKERLGIDGNCGLHELCR